MGFADDMERLLGTLSTVAGVRTVTEGWMKEAHRMPVIAVDRASVEPAAYADDVRQQSRLCYYVRLFTVGAAERRELSGGIDRVMCGLGYRLKNAVDSQADAYRLCTMMYVKEFEG